MEQKKTLDGPGFSDIESFYSLLTTLSPKGLLKFDAELLRRIRNDLPLHVTIAALGRKAPPSKWSEGFFRFLCPGCGEMKATVNPRNNLAHCFCCLTNLNNIDLLMTLGYEFRPAVLILQTWLEQYEARQGMKRQSPAAQQSRQ